MTRGLLPAVLILAVAPAGAQEVGRIWVEAPDGGERIPVALHAHQGYAAVGVEALELLGWTILPEGEQLRARLPGGSEIRFEPGIPFVQWGGQLFQLAEAPYVEAGDLFAPAQLLVDLLPALLPRAYLYDAEARTLRVLQPDLWRGGPPLVIIDPGHGGKDSGTRGIGGTLEKDVALGIARVLRDELSADPGLDVQLTRDQDVLVPLWERGENATAWKDGRPGVFISIHANASPSSRATRGFETFFLSEARTEHARRVAALENAALSDGNGPDLPDGSDLEFILMELRNLGYQSWSALLAEIIQEELKRIHPGPDRGVKQGPFAVMTNTIMPAVLVEVGFISNREEERLLGSEAFQREAAEALAQSVRRFMKRYPPR